MEIKIKFDNVPYWMEYQNLEYKGPFFHRNTLEIVFVMKGELTIETDNEELVLKEGEFTSINAGISHILRGSKETYINSLYLNLNYYEKQYPYIHGHSFYCLYHEDGTDDFELYYLIRNFFIRLMIIEYLDVEEQFEMGKKICDTLMNVLIYHIFDAQFTKNKISVLKLADKERLFSMTQYLAEHFNQQGLTLADLAANENLSTTRLSHFWKSITNISFIETIGMYRYNEAKRLLMSSDRSVSEISDVCGYSDEKYLYKVFKQKHDMTPKEFRDHHREILKQPDIYKPYDITGIYDFLVDYASRFYYTITDFSFIEGNPQIIQEEKNLNTLYGVIIAIEKKRKDGEPINDTTVGLSIGLNRGFRYCDQRFEINWEYMYAVLQITIHHLKKSHIIIPVELMTIEEWVEMFNEITEKVKKKWGESFNSSTHLLISYLGYDNYAKALKLEKELNNTKYFAEITTILSL